MFENNSILIPILILGAITVATDIVISVIVGGFKMGALERTLEIVAPTEELALLLERMKARLLALGFREGKDRHEFLQGGKGFADSIVSSVEGGSPHSKTHKALRVTLQEEGPNTRVFVSMKYLSFITGDTGESAYRDAVLDYAMGKSEIMATVPNVSSQATHTVATALVMLCAIPFLLSRLGGGTTVVLALALGATNIFFAVLALTAIIRRPQELRGTGYAIAGIVMTLLAIALAVALFFFR